MKLGAEFRLSSPCRARASECSSLTWKDGHEWSIWCTLTWLRCSAHRLTKLYSFFLIKIFVGSLFLDTIGVMIIVETRRSNAQIINISFRSLEMLVELVFDIAISNGSHWHVCLFSLSVYNWSLISYTSLCQLFQLFHFYLYRKLFAIDRSRCQTLRHFTSTFIFVFFLFFYNTWLLFINMPLQYVFAIKHWDLIFINLVECNSHKVSKVHKTNSELRRHLFGMLFLVKTVQVLSEMLFELNKTWLNLILLCLQNIWVLQVGYPHRADLSE